MQVIRKKLFLTQYLKSVKCIHFGLPDVRGETLECERDLAFKEGFQRGISDSQEKIDEITHTLNHRIIELFKKINDQFFQMQEVVLDKLPELITTVIKRILPKISIDQTVILSIISEALNEFAKKDQPMKIFLSKEDFAYVEFLRNKLSQTCPLIDFEMDSLLSSGDCKIKSDFGIIDAKISTKLKLLSQVLSE